MRVAHLRLRHFRNHTDTTLEFGDGINALFGDNGQGKTNVLEAISYLSLTKSFYAVSDRAVLQRDQELFEVEGDVITDNVLEHIIRVRYSREGGKFFTVNGVRPDTMASVIGRFPIVILSPENSAITFGGPAERRRFMDLLLSQISRAYLEDLLEYRRALKQRNKLLLEAKLEQAFAPDLLEPWTASIVNVGARILRHRAQFVKEFCPRVKQAYLRLIAAEGRTNGREEPDLEYISLPGIKEAPTVEEICLLMQEEVQQCEHEERRRGTTLVGPHRDDLRLTLNGMVMQQFASQGQHKTMLVALKMAEYSYLRERREENPVMLLDDVFSELDEQRSRLVLDATGFLGQTFITTTDERVFRGAIPWDGRHRRFHVEGGTVRAT